MTIVKIICIISSNTYVLGEEEYRKLILSIIEKAKTFFCNGTSGDKIAQVHRKVAMQGSALLHCEVCADVHVR